VSADRFFDGAPDDRKGSAAQGHGMRTPLLEYMAWDSPFPTAKIKVAHAHVANLTASLTSQKNKLTDGKPDGGGLAGHESPNFVII
jgi:hypothetical protein